MIFRSIEFLAYSGAIAAMLALSIATFSFLFLNTDINYILLSLIFFGTLVVYNLDHLVDLNSDKITNPKRVNFIIKNKSLIYLIIGLSIVVSVSAVLYLGIKIIPIIVLPFFLGIIHRKIKTIPIFSALYITISWLIITVYLPAIITDRAGQVITLSAIVGILLFFNAYTSSLRQKSYAPAYIRYMMYFSLGVTVLLIVFRGNYFGLIPMVFFTTIALANYFEDENYELIFLDGLQLLGSVISVLILVLVKH